MLVLTGFCLFFLTVSDETRTHTHSEGGDTLEQVAQGGCGCLIPGGIGAQAGCGSAQPGLLVGDPVHLAGGVETPWSLRSFSTQAVL